MIINIKSVDILFFRDSKPFGRGSEHFTKSIFPPSSQTLYGALRTKVLENLGCDYEEFKKGIFVFKNQELVNKIGLEKIKDEIGTVDKIGNFTLKGPFLLHKDDVIYLKLPADVKEVSGEYKILHPFNWNNFGIETDLGILNNYPHIITDELPNDEDGYISLQAFINYILGEEIKKEDVKKSKDIFDYEMRTGIEVKPSTNTTEEGRIYTMGYVRLNDGLDDKNKGWSLYAKIENLSALPDSGFIKFGGANRVCEYSKLLDDPMKYYFNEIDKIKELIEKTKKFKMVFLTPTIFKKGWLSEKFDNNFEMQIDNIKIKLITAVIGRPDNVSGWDLAKNKAKPLRRLVPAGSVYYFGLLEGGVDELLEKLNFVNFSDENSNLRFGLTLIGGVKNV